MVLAPKSSSTKIDELSPAKRALLELRMKQRRALERETIPVRDRSRPALLSFTQELLWLQHQISPGSAYNVPRALRLKGRLDVASLRATLYDIVERHEILRTRYTVVDGTPYQVVSEGFNLPLEAIDLTILEPIERDQKSMEIIKARSNGFFDLSSDLLLRATLILMDTDDHVLVLVTHHIASDGWSRDVLYREMAEIYTAHSTRRPSALPRLSIQYSDYSAWQRESAKSAAFKNQLTFWKEQLAGAPALIEVPTDFPRPLAQTADGERVRRQLLNSKEVASLKQIGKQESATLFMTTLACAMIFLNRHTGQDDLVVGTPILGRDRPEIESLLGYFSNTLALRISVANEATFRDVIREARRVSVAAFEHPDLPFAKLVQELNPERNLSYNPVFQILFGFGQGSSDAFDLADVSAEPIVVDRGVTKFDLSISMSEGSAGLIGCLDYRVDLYKPETISCMMDRLQTLTRLLLQNPDTPIAELSITTAAERNQLLYEWNDTTVNYSGARTFNELFEAQVKRSPATIALEYAGRQMSYAELDQRANRLANYLGELGVGPDVPVGVLVGRSERLIVTLLAVLKAGGAYVPLDENYPGERVEYVLSKSKAPIVITESLFEPNVAGFGGRKLYLDKLTSELSLVSSDSPVIATTSHNQAYIMFTSGSTGLPKGIAVPHSCLVHYAQAAADLYRIKPGERVLQFASICFDTSIEEIFPCLSTGATLVVRTPEMLDSLSSFWDRCGDWGITFVSLPTAFWHELSREAETLVKHVPSSVRTLVIGGEKAQADRLKLWRHHNGTRIRLVNTYGPTESTVVASCCDITDGDFEEIPIGRPIPNVKLYILDDIMQPVPRGVSGEIYIGGRGVARGYIDDAARTDEVFLVNPFVAGERIYRTGDLGRHLVDGNIQFTGRRDSQVKIRGFRVELGEIEAVLGQHPSVGEVAVVAACAHGSDMRLAAYVTPTVGSEIASNVLRGFLQERLPAYMIPALFVAMPEFRKTSGGKVDRRALPIPSFSDQTETDDAFEAPQTASEEALAVIWQEVLGVSRVGIDDNFFDLGGHSLLAIRLLSRIHREEAAGLSLAEMFKAPTVRAMAELLRLKAEGEQKWTSLVPLKLGGSRPPLFCAPVYGGSAFYYNTLASCIHEDQPMYALEPIGLNGVDDPHQSIEEMAAHYISQIRSIQPNGPYTLCGLSLGGVVAFEMARQLTATGDSVDSVILFDTWAPGILCRKKNVGNQQNGPHCAQNAVGNVVSA